LAVGDSNQKIAVKPSKQWCAKSRMRGSKTAYPIWIKFCRVIDVADAITRPYANFDDDWLRG